MYHEYRRGGTSVKELADGVTRTAAWIADLSTWDRGNDAVRQNCQFNVDRQGCLANARTPGDPLWRSDF